MLKEFTYVESFSFKAKMSEPLLVDPIDKNATPAVDAGVIDASVTDSMKDGDGCISETNLTTTKTHPLPTTTANIVDCDEDLEDGEITDDDDDCKKETNDKDDCIIVSATPLTVQIPQKQKSNVIIEVSTDNSMSSPNTTPKTTKTTSVPKSKKPQPVEDDHASSIEHALANVLKKKGIELEMPAISDGRNGHVDSKDSEVAHGQSRKSRQRKRKRERDQRVEEKKKERKEKKKSRYDSREPSPYGGPPPMDDDEMDDYEMLNVRGGSPPPPVAMLPMSLPIMPPVNDYDMGASSYSSYESNDSVADDNASGGRRKRGGRGKKDSKNKKRRNRDERSNREKRRRNSDDDSHRQEPRKMELCKFYLLECCAKRENCSYMHSDFPCKYYYLGLDCPEDEDCKFMHGKPLSDQLRNILLKHLESAPQEILGNFKRIGRESAIAQITKRHEALCKKYNLENTWNSIPLAQIFGRRQNNDSKDKHYQQQLQQLQQQLQKQQQQLQQQQQQQQQQQSNKSAIPSLLDMVIKPPEMDDSPSKNDKRGDVRKSRWESDDDDDSDNGNGGNENNKRDSFKLDPPSKDAPRHLDLKNLRGILSDEHIEKLSDLGVVNLDQINQLSLGQLNQIGLTITELSEIQMRAAGNCKDKNKSGDVNHTAINVNASASKVPATKSLNAINANSLLTVDYSQYLKDSNLAFDRSDIYDDEDNEQLVIADDHMEHDDRKPKLESEENSSTLFDELLGFNSTVHKNPFSQPENANKQLRQTDDASSTSTIQSQTTNFNDIRAIMESVRMGKPTNNTNSQEQDSDQKQHQQQQERLRQNRSRSRTPSQSSTPEASSPEPEENEVRYERQSMYDYNVQPDDDSDAAAKKKADMDMRFLPSKSSEDGFGDLDMRLPFTPVLNYTPATEIDASFLSHLPIRYHLIEFDVPRPNYKNLRLNSSSIDRVMDPRLRRILALPELTQTTKTSTLIGRNVRKTSSIASPDSEDMSPKYYVPGAAPIDERLKMNAQAARDPRRAAASTSHGNKSNEGKSSSTHISHSSSSSSTGSVPQKPNTDIRNMLQSSQWYKGLNSKFKIMVNQQLAQVTTELKKFHQDESPNKIFDISFILNNPTLQQILTHLGIYIDDNGEVSQIEADNDDAEGQQREKQQNNAANSNNQKNINNSNGGIELPNLSQPPPTASLNFLRNPPPNIVQPADIFRASITPGGPPQPAVNLNLAPFVGPQNARPSLLGLPPGVQPRFNPFSGNPLPPNIDFLAGGSAVGPGLLGMAPPQMNFGNFTAGPGGMPQRKFMQQQRNNNQRNQQRSKRI